MQQKHTENDTINQIHHRLTQIEAKLQTKEEAYRKLQAKMTELKTRTHTPETTGLTTRTRKAAQNTGEDLNNLRKIEQKFELELKAVEARQNKRIELVSQQIEEIKTNLQKTDSP